jgi:histone-lysine N-methyltransferase MLL3
MNSSQKRKNEQSGKQISNIRPSRSSRRLEGRNYSDGGDSQSNSCSSMDPNQNELEQLDEPTIGHIKRDEDEHHAVTVLVSLEDSFTLRQDMCLSCGSFGKDEEGRLISCSQCGQCYHTYCAGVNKVRIYLLTFFLLI